MCSSQSWNRERKKLSISEEIHKMRHLLISQFINFNPSPRFHNILLTVSSWFLPCCYFFRENDLIFFLVHTFSAVDNTKKVTPILSSILGWNQSTETQSDSPFGKTELCFPNIALQFLNTYLLLFVLTLWWYCVECRLIYLALVLYRSFQVTLQFLNCKSLTGTW